MNDIVVTSFFIFFLSLDFTIIISDARRPQTHKHIHQHSFARSLFRSVLFILHPRKRPHLLQQLLRHLDPTLFILPLTLSLDRVLSLVLFSVVQALDVVLAKLETRRAILRLCHALDSFEKSSSVSQTHAVPVVVTLSPRTHRVVIPNRSFVRSETVRSIGPSLSS